MMISCSLVSYPDFSSGKRMQLWRSDTKSDINGETFLTDSWRGLPSAVYFILFFYHGFEASCNDQASITPSWGVTTNKLHTEAVRSLIWDSLSCSLKVLKVSSFWASSTPVGSRLNASNSIQLFIKDQFTAHVIWKHFTRKVISTS